MNGDGFWDCHINSHTIRYAELIKCETWVRCNDRAGTEVNSFAHQVATKTPFFALQPLSNCLQRLARLLFVNRLASYRVIHESGNIVLQASC
jgi:hypothetical protein